jgi:hypothetical protein
LEKWAFASQAEKIPGPGHSILFGLGVDFSAQHSVSKYQLHTLSLGFCSFIHLGLLLVTALLPSWHIWLPEWLVWRRWLKVDYGDPCELGDPQQLWHQHLVALKNMTKDTSPAAGHPKHDLAARSCGHFPGTPDVSENLESTNLPALGETSLFTWNSIQCVLAVCLKLLQCFLLL